MEQSVTDLFLARVANDPDAPAIVTDGRDSLSYYALDKKARSIAALLIPGSLVALCLEKSADYIAAMLGCWYAGAAFLPLDPSLPDERRAFILQDARPGCIVTRASHDGLFESLPIICVENIGTRDFTPVHLYPGQLAYVIYTSGSTGRPKGVMVPHRGLPGMLQAQIGMFGLRPGSRSLFFLSTAFDASVSDIGTALLSGATLFIETDDKVALAARLPALLRERGITYIDMPPSLLRLIEPEDMPGSLETIVIGGEACPPETVRRWAGRVRLINVYGPTEATVCTSLCLCGVDWSRPLIGDALPGVDYLILDDGGNRADDGELHIGGRQLALGYMNNPELTARKFIGHGPSRLYRTGDRVRRLADGGIEFLGRIDRQVKLRGQLVELEEIETQIAHHPAVARVSVLKRTVDGRDQLVAFVAPRGGDTFEPAGLKKWLQPVLPEWMIPGRIVILANMPLTVSGKIDAHYLEHMAVPGVTEPVVPSHPADAGEQILLTLWQRVLKRTAIGRDDDFFDLGGDSMAVLELSMDAELRQIPLTPALIVEHPTLARQAAWLAGRNGMAHEAGGAMPAARIRRDVAPGEEWRAMLAGAAARAPAAPSFDHVFMTGGTGFLGGRLLLALLQTSNAHMHVLVRAVNDDEAWRRLNIPASYRNRVHVVRGDFSLPRCGLSGEAWDALAARADAIVHCGALVNMVLPYAALRPANIEGVKEMVRLACAGRRKILHYASTLSVFVSTDCNAGTALEDDRLERTATVYGGYGQTKWGADYMMQAVPVEACPIAIYRLGLITGDTIEGRCADRDFLNMFVKGLIALGCVPEGPHERMEVDATPVDYAAAAMGRLVVAGSTGTFHLANKKGFSLAAILRGLARHGHAIETVALDRWMALKELSPVESAAYMALCRCMPRDYYERNRVMDLFQATDIRFDCRRTEAALEGSGIAVPPADDALLALYLHAILAKS